MLFFLKGLAGLLGGALAGVVVTLGIVVARVRMQGTDGGRAGGAGGGHDHPMQLLRGSGHAPSHTIVSGAASKLTGVGDAPGLVFARSEPRFARLLVLRDGSLHLTPAAEYVSCPALDPQRARCMAEASAAYRVVWSERLSNQPR